VRELQIRQKGKRSLVILIFSMNTNCEIMVYRSSRGVRKVTTGIIGFVYYESRKRELKTRPIHWVPTTIYLEFIMNQESERQRQNLCMSVGTR
jgi:hypothetical protein